MRIRPKNIEDQVIVITGTSSGIGLATARMAVQRGARVAVAAREQETLDRLSDQIKSQRGEALAVAADVTRFDDIKSLAQRTIELEHSFYTEAATRPRLKRLLTMTTMLGLGAVLLTKTRSSMS